MRTRRKRSSTRKIQAKSADRTQEKLIRKRAHKVTKGMDRKGTRKRANHRLRLRPKLGQVRQKEVIPEEETCEDRA